MKIRKISLAIGLGLFVIMIASSFQAHAALAQVCKDQSGIVIPCPPSGGPGGKHKPTPSPYPSYTPAPTRTQTPVPTATFATGGCCTAPMALVLGLGLRFRRGSTNPQDRERPSGQG